MSGPGRSLPWEGISWLRSPSPKSPLLAFSSKCQPVLNPFSFWVPSTSNAGPQGPAQGSPSLNAYQWWSE